MNINRLRKLAGLTENTEPLEYFSGNIEQVSRENELYRKVLYTGPKMQLVIMSIPPGEQIGEEVHEHGDQFIRIEGGEGVFVIAGNKVACKDGDAVIIPAGMSHNVKNTGKAPLQLYAIYSPPEHKPNTVHATKADSKRQAE